MGEGVFKDGLEIYMIWFDMFFGVSFCVVVFDYLIVEVWIVFNKEVVDFVEWCCCLGMSVEEIEMVEKLGF